MTPFSNNVTQARRPQVSEPGNGARRHGYVNAIYGVADYLAFPIGMLLAAPFLLRHLGAAQYGVWILASAAVSSGGAVAGSFGDAVIKHVGECRSRQDWAGVAHIVRNMISINLVLSTSLAICLWVLAPYVTRHVVKADVDLRIICLWSLRIGSALILVKSIESIFISALRAFEDYGPTVRIAIYARVAMLVSAILLAGYGRNVIWIMLATLLITTSGMVAQALALRATIGTFLLLPSWHIKTISDVASFGAFSWIQAIAGVAFGQLDRLLVGFLMGAPAVAYYSLCVQAAQPIHGLVASGMHFLFPHLSTRYSVDPISEIRHKVVSAIKVNAILVGALCLPILVFGERFLSNWIGPAFGQAPPQILPLIACGFALLGMNVTAHYVLLAVGQVKIVTYLNLLAGTVMLILMVTLVPHYGLQGAGWARFAYGPITCLAYLQVHRVIWRREPQATMAESRAALATDI